MAAIQKSTHTCSHVECLQARRKRNPQGKRPWIQRSSDGASIWRSDTQLTLKPGRQVFSSTETFNLTDVKLRDAKRLPHPVMKLELIFFPFHLTLNLFSNTRSSCSSLAISAPSLEGAPAGIRTRDPPSPASCGIHFNQSFLNRSSSVCASCCLKRQNNLIYVFICQRG